MTATLLYKDQALLGEGPIWNHLTQELHWIDIEGKQLHWLNPRTGMNQSIATPSLIGTVVPIDEESAIVGLYDGAYLVNRTTSQFELFQPIDSANGGTRLNDGKCDPAGRFWVGTMYLPQDQPNGHLYMLDGNKNLVVQKDGITISNGIVWTQDAKTMYYIDSPTNQIKGFDYDLKTGSISNERVVVSIDKSTGEPDGMAIDEEGKLWVGLWNGNAVLRFDPYTGEMIQKIDVPAHNVTACAFGGKELDSLFITTASLDMTEREKEKYPDAGSIFVVVPGVKGVKSDFFKLN